MTVVSPLTLPTKKQLRPLAQKYGLRLIVLFGSAARDRMNKESDVDIGVLTKRPLTINQRLNLWGKLTEFFRMDVDLAVLNHADPLFGFEVSRDGKVLFEGAPNVWENWRSYKIRQFWDTEKFYDDMRRYVAKYAEEISDDDVE